MTPSDRHRQPTPVVVGLGSVAALAAALVVLLVGPLEPVDLIFPGLRGGGAEVVVADFPGSTVPDRYSYDGQEYYVAARHLPDLDAAERDMDGPDYRLLRILAPAIASLGGDGVPVVALLVLCNLVGVGLASAALADIAARHGRDPRVGAAAAVALAIPTLISTPEPLAFGLGFAAIALADRDRVLGASAALALALLAREGAIIFALVVALQLFLRRRVRDAVTVLAISLTPAAVWAIIVRTLVEKRSSGTSALLGFLDLPAMSALDWLAMAATIALAAVALLTWHDVRSMLFLIIGFVVPCLVYHPSSYTAETLPRLSAPVVALGLAGAAQLAIDRRGARLVAG